MKRQYHDIWIMYCLSLRHHLRLQYSGWWPMRPLVKSLQCILSQWMTNAFLVLALGWTTLNRPLHEIVIVNPQALEVAASPTVAQGGRFCTILYYIIYCKKNECCELLFRPFLYLSWNTAHVSSLGQLNLLVTPVLFCSWTVKTQNTKVNMFLVLTVIQWVMKWAEEFGQLYFRWLEESKQNLTGYVWCFWQCAYSWLWTPCWSFVCAVMLPGMGGRTCQEQHHQTTKMKFVI